MITTGHRKGTGVEGNIEERKQDCECNSYVFTSNAINDYRLQKLKLNHKKARPTTGKKQMNLSLLKRKVFHPDQYGSVG